nr:YqaE/Pmp3 family membrane protein [Pleurocapsa sp. FMAR1]
MRAHSNKIDIIRIICAIFVPPLGVFLQTGFSTLLAINIVLTLHKGREKFIPLPLGNGMNFDTSDLSPVKLCLEQQYISQLYY